MPIATDVIWVVIRQVPEDPRQWYPVASFSTATAADDYIAAQTTLTNYVSIQLRITS